MSTDPWATWQNASPFRGDPLAERSAERWLATVRDRVLHLAAVRKGDTLLDAGSGDGLIGLGALEHVGRSGRVILVDISQKLLAQAMESAQARRTRKRCSFLRASLDTLSYLGDRTVDVATTRSVLIYIQEKRKLLAAFHRVLRPGGRIALGEPINAHRVAERRPGVFRGYHLPETPELADRMTAWFAERTPSSMIDFDERDLVAMCRQAGFLQIHLELQYDLRPKPPLSWTAFLDQRANPLVPSLRQAMKQILTESESDAFEAELRPKVEAGEGQEVLAFAFLSARKAGAPGKRPSEEWNLSSFLRRLGFE